MNIHYIEYFLFVTNYTLADYIRKKKIKYGCFRVT